MTRGIVLLLLLASAAALPAAPAGEPELVAILQSAAEPAQKEAACQRLKRIGTAACVPALAALLADEGLSMPARDALESMPIPEAAAALRHALERTSGRTRAGIIDSLAARRDRDALPDLAPLLADPNPMVASSAAAAVSRIGGPEAVAALRAALRSAPRSVAIADGLLRCADALRLAGDTAGAVALYTEVAAPGGPEPARVAAHRGLIVASGARAVSRIAEALRGDDAAARTAALNSIRDLPGSKTTSALAALLGRAPADVQTMLLVALGQRGDPAAQGAVARAAKSPEVPVRLAALSALAELGDASQVGLLAERAASGAGPEREAARQALTRLRSGDACRAIERLLPGSRPPVRIELIQALARRSEKGAVPALLKLAAGKEEDAAVAALAALASLADEVHARSLVALLAGTGSDTIREAAVAALVSVGGRSAHPESVAALALDAMPGAAVPARCALLGAAGQVGGAAALAALRAGTRDPGAEIRDAAIRTLAEYGPVEALSDLLGLAQGAGSPAQQVLALRGYWRLVGLSGTRPAEERLRLCRDGLAACRRPDEKRLALAEVGAIPHPEALSLAEGMCADPALREEAELACVQVAGRLLGSQRGHAEETLRRLAEGAAAERVRTDAKAALDTLARYREYVVPWLVSGPYREAGKECQQLYDVAFAPETAGTAEWRPLPPPADPLAFWQADLGGVVGGNHCIVYVKTRVFSPEESPVALEIGTDDGIKLWVNGELVHANNAVRGLTPGQDHASCRLKRGWNDFLAKVTQHTAGCGLCLRIVAPDGANLPGLKTDPQGQ